MSNIGGETEYGVKAKRIIRRLLNRRALARERMAGYRSIVGHLQDIREASLAHDYDWRDACWSRDDTIREQRKKISRLEAENEELRGNKDQLVVALDTVERLQARVAELEGRIPVLCPKCHGTGRVKVATQIAPGVRGCHFHAGEQCECRSGAVWVQGDDAVAACTGCLGTGRVYDQDAGRPLTCPACHGSGREGS